MNEYVYMVVGTHLLWISQLTTASTPEQLASTVGGHVYRSLIPPTYAFLDDTGKIADHRDMILDQTKKQYVDQLRGILTQKLSNLYKYTPGSSDINREKYDQAVEWLARLQAGVEVKDFPMLRFEADSADSSSITTVAQTILDKRARWAQDVCTMENSIPKIRQQIYDCNTRVELDTLMTTLDNPRVS